MNKILAAAVLSAIFTMVFIILSLVNDRNIEKSFQYLVTALMFEIIFALLV